jgi:hypothetical protein
MAFRANLYHRLLISASLGLTLSSSQSNAWAVSPNKSDIYFQTSASGSALLSESLKSLIISQLPLPTYGPPCQPGVQEGYLQSRDANSPINVREGASTSTYARHIGYAGDSVNITDLTIGEDGYCWYQVQFLDSGATGWIRADFVGVIMDRIPSSLSR